MNSFKPMTLKPDFSINLTQLGRNTWVAFFGSVHKQGTSATDAISQLMAIIESSLETKKETR